MNRLIPKKFHNFRLERPLDTRGADDIKKIKYLQGLEYEYPEGILEQAPWASSRIRFDHGNIEEEITVEEFKRRHCSIGEVS